MPKPKRLRKKLRVQIKYRTSPRQDIPKPVFVHLGNAGPFFARAMKTKKYSERFSNVEFVGIDLKQVTSNKPNWRQINANFADGLNQLEDHSVSLISSDFALGFYTPKGRHMFKGKQVEQHTEETIRIAYQKLKAGGKLLFAVNKPTGMPLEYSLTSIRISLEKAGFKQCKLPRPEGLTALSGQLRAFGARSGGVRGSSPSEGELKLFFN